MSATYELDRKHVFHSWSAQAEISPMVITAARGSYVWDDEDRRYLDFSSQLVFTNGGPDANEHAVRMARLHTGRFKVLSAYRSYHGGTQTAINMTGDPRRWANDTATSGTVRFFGPFLYRSEFHATSEAEECERALAHL